MTRDQAGDNLLSALEVARMLGISTRTLNRWEASGWLVPLRLPTGHRRYQQHQVDALLDTNHARRAATVSSGDTVRQATIRSQPGSTSRAVVVPTDMYVGERVHLLLRRRQITQSELVQTMGISPSTLSKKLRGRVTWTVHELLVAAEFLAVPVDDLLPPR